MKQFKDITITGPNKRLRTLIEEISQNLPAEWSRDFESKSRLKGIVQTGEGPGFVFARKGKNNDPASGVFVAHKSGRLYIPNIVPRESGRELSIVQYNRILDEFADIVRTHLPSDGELVIEVTSDDSTITDWVSGTAAELLNRFSICANKATGSSNSEDFQRWAAFLVQVHTDRSTLPSSVLAQWLVEELGWLPDQADELAIEYEFARNLLRAYDESR
jgi:hypothetical protein